MNDRENIVKLAQVIQDAMRAYVMANPSKGEFGDYEIAIKVGYMAAMRFGKGQYNPSFIDSLVRLERSVFDGTGYSLPC